jgi:hypothetical protein
MTFKMRRSFGKLDADVIAGALDVIYQERGEITAPAVVESARPKKAPLHPAFEWDDSKAAEEHRLWQARQIVRSVVVVNDDTKAETPQYVHVQVVNQTEGRYLPASVVVQNVDLFQRALAELQGKVSAIRQAIASLESMARDGGDSERMMRVALAVKALETANSALAAIH